jgi:beta-lactamase class A
VEDRAPAETVDTPILHALRDGIVAVGENLPGRLGVLVRLLDLNLEVGYNDTASFPTASIIKIPIMVEVFRQIEEGSLTLDETIPVLPDDLTGGSGVLQFLHVGLPLSVRDAVELMIIISDNTATNLLLRRIGGSDRVNTTMDHLGLIQTRSAGSIGRHNPSEPTKLSSTTPREMGELLQRILKDQVVTPGACASMRDILEHQIHDAMLPRHLPITEDSLITVGHKTGAINHVRNDVGYISVVTDEGRRTAIVSALTADLDDGNLWTVENIGDHAVATIGKMVYDALLEL